MLEALKLVHFFGFILGIGGGVANAVAAAKLTGIPPEVGPTVGRFREALGKMSTFGLVLLWLSGIALIAMRADISLLSDGVFQLKLAAVVALTGFSIAANLTVFAAKKASTPPNAARMKSISMGANIFGTLALVLAIIAFS